MNEPKRRDARTPAEQDFPVDRVEAQHVARREFAKYLVVVSGGLAAGSGWVAVKDSVRAPERLTQDTALCPIEEVPVNGMKMVRHPLSDEPLIVLRHADGTVRAFEQKCTHLSCAVFYSAASQRIECPCHAGAFDAHTGAVLEGPPPRALRSYAVAVRGGAVVLLAEVPRAAEGVA
jgi:nitrite reductase/ring-hydroxylating ferredoxin subunit